MFILIKLYCVIHACMIEESSEESIKLIHHINAAMMKNAVFSRKKLNLTSMLNQQITLLYDWNIWMVTNSLTFEIIFRIVDYISGEIFHWKLINENWVEFIHQYRFSASLRKPALCGFGFGWDPIRATRYLYGWQQHMYSLRFYKIFVFCSHCNI